jgi:hypothetical protein
MFHSFAGDFEPHTFIEVGGGTESVCSWRFIINGKNSMMVSLSVHGYSADTGIPHYEVTTCSWLLPPLMDLWTQIWWFMCDRVVHIQPWMTLVVLKKTNIMVLIYLNTKAASDLGDAGIFPCMDWCFVYRSHWKANFNHRRPWH